MSLTFTNTHWIIRAMRYALAAVFAERVLEKGEHKGYAWVIVHNGRRYRCGYVCVLPGHPWFGKNYEEIDPDVHGGLTFAGHGDADEYWVGFDCAHAGDAPDPNLPYTRGPRGFRDPFPPLWPSPYSEEIRTQEYVRKECEHLAEQADRALKEAASA